MTPATARMPRVAFKTMGCRLNRVETDSVALALERRGCEIVPEQEADAIIVNTCAVTGEAEAKCRKSVRHALSLPQRPYVFATGCMAALFADELAELGDHIRVVTDKAALADTLYRTVTSGYEDTPDEVGATVTTGSKATDTLTGEAVATPTVDATPTPTGRTRPGIKVQDGCDNRCAFCIVWKARGTARSVSPAEAVRLVREAQGRGAHEVVLSGINLGSYRYECDGAAMRLPELLEHILECTDVERVRLSSLEPPDVTRRLCEVIADSGGRIAPFLHVCLQSGCDETLRRMGRVYDSSLYRSVVEQARELIPDLALGCDLIVGFPGETDEEFERSYEFCREMHFAKMHVFRYSRRPGTPAATMPDQVSASVSADRSRRMRALADAMRRQNASAAIGKQDLVLVQSPGRAVSGGLYDVLVDDRIPVDYLVRVTPHAILESGFLDARPVQAQA